MKKAIIAVAVAAVIGTGCANATKQEQGALAGAVLGAFRTICAAHPAINVICVVPSSENLINGEATKPGDVVTAYNGKTIEIYNTDAEGRLILADALAYTVETQKPDIMIDVATLTGACIVALGHEMSAVISEDNELVNELTQALNLSQPKVSRHLAQLRQGGLINDERSAQWVYYQMAQHFPDWLQRILATLSESYAIKSQYQQDQKNLIKAQQK